jgi:tetratricopeptide (TPR) repeat protein
LIVRKDPEDYNFLLRRYTLSAYNPGQGFHRMEDIDELAHPGRLPGRRLRLPVTGIEAYRVTNQEYYIVNFDASAFIGMNMPVEIIPFETWDASSFNSAYAVRSHTSQALPYELIQAVQGEPDAVNLGLNPEEYALYTNYGRDEVIAGFARQIIREETSRLGLSEPPSYWEKIEMIYVMLKYGEYRYSLKPGIAPDGDQLKHFLFTAKRGYCSYFAFAFTLMLRSLGIPSRIAAGFFVDPSTETFGYYPVRADMAHAWVEVWFPHYGWIEYDPTTQTLAEGEEFRFSRGTPPELFERLMKEILENRSRLRARDWDESEREIGELRALGRKTLQFFARRGYAIALAMTVLFFLALRCGFLWLSLLVKNPRKKVLYLWAHTKRRLALAAYQRAGGDAEWAKTQDDFRYIYSLYLGNAAARFAPLFTHEDSFNMIGQYRLFNEEYRNIVPLRRRLLAWLLPPLALILVKKGKPDKNINTVGIVLLFIFLFTLRGDAQDDSLAAAQRAGILYDSAIAAQRAENWERAIELLSEGIRAYPQDYRFPWSLGNLYYGRRLYNLAWDEFRRAERIIQWDQASYLYTAGLLFQLASTAGYLNKNDISAAYLERLFALEPDNREVIGNLAWMYFKLHRFHEGESLLLDAMARLGQDMDLYMTLGTIYLGMLRYEESKDAYLKAISGAENTGDRLFAALAHYNLSILENRFFQFSLAYERTNASLAAMNRSSGRLARGELYLSRLELPQALADFQDAYLMDSSPLPRLNLARVYQIAGRLKEAELYARACLQAEDESWMRHYGIDPVRYRRDIHKILKDTYKGLFHAEAFSCPGNLRERGQSLARRISYRFRHSVHAHLFRKYSLISAKAWGIDGEIHLDALTQYCYAFESYPRRAFAYFSRARSFEMPLIPETTSSYGFNEGRLLKNRQILAEIRGEFDPLWQRNMIARVYAELANIGGKTGRQDAAERLFALNRGALLQNGLRLPVELRFANEIFNIERTLKRAARAAGLESSRLAAPRYTLSFSSGVEGIVSCELYDNGRGIIVWRQDLPAPNRWGSQRANFAQALRDGIFSVF